MNKVFEINDLKNLIFSFLRKKPQQVCCTCKKVLIWDKEVNPYILIKANDCKSQFYECLNCYYVAQTREFF